MEKTTDEHSLIERAQGGSIEAFEQIVRTHQRIVRTFVARHVGNQQTADDISQDVFVAAYRGVDRYLGTGSVSAWLLGIARNHVLTYLRNKSRAAAVSVDAVLDDVHLSCLDQDPFDDEAEALRVDALRSCIQSLDGPQRNMLMRFYYQSETAEAIARSERKPAGTIRMNLLRIRKQLRACIDNKLRAGGPLQ